MSIFFRCLLIGLLSIIGQLQAKTSNETFYRNFWFPTYRGERLHYCDVQGKECGLKVATRYCKMLGFASADQHIIDHNIGLANFLSTKAYCKGWRCDGFKTIRCVAFLPHRPPQSYSYRFKHFVFPRYDHYRVAWCYDGYGSCGAKAAYSFCRRMGYLGAKNYKLDQGIAATKALGNQKLCFGKHCNAFSYIDCYR